MAKAAYPLKLPASLKEVAAEMAERDGVSLNQWIVTTIALRVGAMESTRDFFGRRAEGARSSDLLRILEKVPAGETLPGDELPENYRRQVAKPAAE